jgi:predicted amidophosphoribosyltransferase
MKNRTFSNFCKFGHILINKIANFILPKEKRVKELETLGPDGLFENIPRAENFDIATNKIKAIFNYKTTLCRQAIWEIKYRANPTLIYDFSLLLYEFILEELTELKSFYNFNNIILLPIPSSPARTREKGFNQCILICQELIRIDQERNGKTFTMVKDFLIKKVDTPHQARVSNRKKRLKNMINAFCVNTKPPNPLVRGKIDSNYSFFIIDDVITTGATMREAFRALHEAGIPPRKIRGFALAH